MEQVFMCVENENISNHVGVGQKWVKIAAQCLSKYF